MAPSRWSFLPGASMLPVAMQRNDSDRMESRSLSHLFRLAGILLILTLLSVRIKRIPASRNRWLKLRDSIRSESLRCIATGSIEAPGRKDHRLGAIRARLQNRLNASHERYRGDAAGIGALG